MMCYPSLLLVRVLVGNKAFIFLRLLSAPESITATSTVRESSVWTSLKTTGVLL